MKNTASASSPQFAQSATSRPRKHPANTTSTPPRPVSRSPGLLARHPPNQSPNQSPTRVTEHHGSGSATTSSGADSGRGVSSTTAGAGSSASTMPSAASRRALTSTRVSSEPTAWL